jgi:hypothetical protein
VKLLEFVRALPDGYAYAPIYQKGAELPDGGTSKGKTPLGRAHHQIMGAADVALQIERAPDVFKAVGVFTGPRSRGLVILDVDANLSKLRKKWGETIEGAPCVTSTKANAAKFLFYVPEALWSQVKGVSLTGSGAGYEVLWGRQGLLYGAYPGSSDGRAPEGEYGLVGDLEAIPEAPAWLVAEMRDAASQSEPVAGKFLKNRKALDFSERTDDEVAEIAQDCLRVIPHLGMGSRDQWIQVGMALHDALPNDLGLTLWSAWSAEDPEYAGEWKDGNPCEKPWGSFRPGAGIRFNSLIWMADQQDPQRRRFSDASRVAVEEVESQKVQRVEQVYMSGAELLERAKKIEDEIDNPALQDQAKHVLALQAGRREGSVAVDRLLLMDMLYGDASGMEPVAVDQMSDDGIDEYLIPGLLPKGWMLLLHADGGTGKTAACQLLVKHLTQAIPFDVFGETVPVDTCRALWLNGDQNPKILKKQLERIGVEKGVDVVGEWDLAWYSRFCRMQKERKYDIVVIDSLDGCNDSNPYEENRREYAKPLKRLQKRNGRDFPLCTFLVIHHNSKAGGVPRHHGNQGVRG